MVENDKSIELEMKPLAAIMKIRSNTERLARFLKTMPSRLIKIMAVELPSDENIGMVKYCNAAKPDTEYKNHITTRGKA